MVIYLAGLVGIPEQYYEVARIDGATRVQQFIHITLPLLRRTFLLVLVLSTILAFQPFEWMYVMTNAGGPAYAAYTIDYLVYVTGLIDFQMGYASSIAFVLFLIILFISFWEMKLEERGE
jgi:multiple sugar transport system permease protein